ncbi:MAG: hypothetical protein WKF82_00375 [Nocardioidaceae bacterium]
MTRLQDATASLACPAQRTVRSTSLTMGQVRSLFLDLTPLKASVPYRRMWLGMSLSAIGTQLTAVAVGLQVYDPTKSTFSVGLVGLFAVVPLIVLGLYGGSIIDA